MVQFAYLLAAAMALANPVALAHPGGHAPENLIKRELLWEASKRSIRDCSASLKGRGLAQRSISRRSAQAAALQEKRGLSGKPLHRRNNYDDVLAESHLSALNGSIGQNVDPAIIFAGNTSCILAPEVTQGPYFVAGENVRHDVRECQEGVEVFLEMQFVDINTCEPVPNIFVDLWHANATGVYAGIVASGNGDSSDATNLDATFLRGLWATNDEGVVQFQTIFPGHYQGRASHIHVVAYEGGAVNVNGTFSGGDLTHVGQLFFDEDLRSAVEAVEPYAGNTQLATTNAEDMLVPTAAGDDYDPFPEYVYLGDSVSDGIFMWISIGVDVNAAYDADYAARLTEDGGIALSGGGGGDGGMGNGTFGGNGTMPSGAPPSGAIPTDLPAETASAAEAAAEEPAATTGAPQQSGSQPGSQGHTRRQHGQNGGPRPRRWF